MRIIFACDHAGFDMKEYLRDVVSSLGYEVEDVGAKQYVEDDDYPDFVALAAQVVSSNPENTKAIILGASGQGEAIVANRFKNVRAVVYVGETNTEGSEKPDIIKLSREHNDSNVLSLGASFLTNATAEEAVRKWLETSFSEDERHIRRIDKIDSLT